MFVQQPRVRVVGGVEHRHALEGDAGPHRVDDAAHDRARLVVGVGGVPHVGAGHRRGIAARDRAAISAPTRRRLATTWASAVAEPVTPATISTSVTSDSARSNAAAGIDQRCGR